MLKIRLKRVGRKHDPSFRIVVVESTKGPKSGNYLETLGNYDARSDKKTVNVDRTKYWISVGAQLSDTVHNILVGEGVISGKKINVLPRKSPIKSKTSEELKTEEVRIEEKPESTESSKEPEAVVPAESEPPVSEEKEKIEA